ncbi:MAG: TonB-dependent receptor [Bacteroides sp.]|nr:TonB-dependent receptor [Bacteroides sp.]MCM1379721.1 TonB-dependent receptor [Bacteroides sp.]MCM1446076.1 TonB-dependent receptor [Prevotella sp.]
MKRFLPYLLFALAYAPARATDSELTEAPDTMALREVSVTAIKLADDLETEPVSSTTVGQQAIQRLNITDPKQLSELVPNFFIPAYGSRMTSSIYVRGLGARIDQPAMGLNVDNIPVLNKNDYDFDFFDIERVEVLRGPQSALYGRNTMGGLINVYTLSPLNYQGMRLLLEGGNFNSWRAAMGLYQMFKPNFGMGLDINAYSTEGQYVNQHTRSLFPKQNRKADQAEQYGARLKLAWLPKDNVSVDNVIAFSYNRQGGYPYELIGSDEVNYNDTCYYNRTSVSEGLTIQWRTDKFTFSSITGLRYLNDDMMLDNDFTPLSYFTLNQKTKESSATQDVVFRGKEGNYNWIAGAFGFVKHTRMTAPVQFQKDGIQNLILANMPTFLQPQWDSEHFYLNSDFVLPNWGAALYHQSEYKLGDWTFTAALRLDYEESAMFYWMDASTGVTIRGAHMALDVHDKDHLKQHWLELLPKVSVSYALPMREPSILYATVSKGYKAGGYNTQMFSTIMQDELIPSYGPNAAEKKKFTVEETASYKPEYSWNYEIGGHFSCMGGKILTDLAAFYIDIRDQQLTVFPDGNSTGRMMTNAGRTRSVGAEASITARPTERWTARASYGYTNAKFLKFSDYNETGELEDYKGNYVPYAPQHTAYASVQYSQPLPMWWFDRVDLEVNGRGVGPIYWNEQNSERQKFYALLGASIRLQLSHVSLDIWGENILNQRFSTFYFKSINNQFIQRGSRRTFGVTLRYIM